MSLGYVLTARQVKEYYLDRPDIREALLAWGRERRTLAGTEADIYGRRGTPLETARRLEEMIEASLQPSPSAVPRKYPAVHACISRIRRGAPTDTTHLPADFSRIGAADLVLDVDIKDNFREAFAQGRRILNLLEAHGTPHRVKFSGNTSPHFILPAEAFPRPLSGQKFRQVAQTVYEYLKRECDAPNLDPYLADPDHYLRMAYSLHENTGLVSVPIPLGAYDTFVLEKAEMPNVTVDEEWLKPMEAPSTAGMESLLTAAGVKRETSVWR